MTTTLTLDDQLRVVNKDSHDLAFMYDRKVYRLPVGGEAFMPFNAIALWFGDPRSAENIAHLEDERWGHMFISDRNSEVRRLQQLYPNSVVTFKEIIPGDRSIVETGISDRAPRVEVFTLSGERVFTVLDDPLGDRVVQAAVPTRFDAVRAEAVIAKQQKQIDMLMQRLGITDEGEAGDVDEDDADIEELPIDRSDTTPAAVRPELRTVPPRPTPTAVVEENPKMVVNPRTGKVARHTVAAPDPTTLEQLPEDV